MNEVFGMRSGETDLFFERFVGQNQQEDAPFENVPPESAPLGAPADAFRIPRWSSRGCKQLLRLTSYSCTQRSINGELVHISAPHDHKYTCDIWCNDKTSLAFDDMCIGSVLWVGCLVFLTVPFLPQHKKVALSRLPVDGSWKAESYEGVSLDIEGVEEKMVHLKQRPSSGGFIVYRPKLIMRLTEYEIQTDEWGMTSGWKMILHEV